MRRYLPYLSWPELTTIILAVAALSMPWWVPGSGVLRARADTKPPSVRPASTCRGCGSGPVHWDRYDPPPQWRMASRVSVKKVAKCYGVNLNDEYREEKCPTTVTRTVRARAAAVASPPEPARVRSASAARKPKGTVSRAQSAPLATTMTAITTPTDPPTLSLICCDPDAHSAVPCPCATDAQAGIVEDIARQVKAREEREKEALRQSLIQESSTSANAGTVHGSVRNLRPATKAAAVGSAPSVSVAGSTPVTTAASRTTAASSAPSAPMLPSDTPCFVDCAPQLYTIEESQRMAQGQLDYLACRVWLDCRFRPFGDTPPPPPPPPPPADTVPYGEVRPLPTPPDPELRRQGFVAGDRKVIRFGQYQVIRVAATIPDGWRDAGVIE